MRLAFCCGLLALLVRTTHGATLPPPALSPGNPVHPDNAPENQLGFLVQLKGKPVIAAFGDLYNNSGGVQKQRNWTRMKEANKYSANLTSAQNALLAQQLRKGSYDMVHSFTHAINAVGVILSSPSQIKLLKNAKGVQRLERDTKLFIQTTHTPAVLGLSIPSSGAWDLASHGDPNEAGEGLIIGVVDTGVTPTHQSLSDDVSVAYALPPPPFLGSCNVNEDNFPAGSCNNKLIGAQYFADSAIAYDFVDPVFDFVSPLDGNGHGTHTSAIAGGNHNISVTVADMSFGIASGIAPRARLSTYKCIYRYGGILSDCIAAFEKAVLDGVNIINLSLGPGSPPEGISFTSTFDLAMLQAVKSGVVVVQSAGNYGPAPGTVTSFSPWIITVGATNTDRTYPVYLNLGSGETIPGLGYSGGSSALSQLISSKDAAFSDSDSGYSPTDCQVAEDLDINIVAGNILLCFYSENFDTGIAVVSQVSITARELNATGFVLLASDPTLNFPIFYDPLPFITPGIFITDLARSQVVVHYYTSNALAAKASISTPSSDSAEFTTVAPVVAYYSSRGPTVYNSDVGDTADVLKPDIVAPGTQIWSAWTSRAVDLPYWNSDFASRSGTSQAAPHVSGVVALIKQAHPTWSPAAIHSALVTSAKQLANNGQPIQAQYPANDIFRPLGPATPFDMGGGFINPELALDPGLIFDRGYTDYINFLCALPGANPQDVLALTGKACNISTGANASDLNMPYITIVKLDGYRQVTRTITSVASAGSETYTASVVVPHGVSLSISPTSFTISSGSKVNFTTSFEVTQAVQMFTFGRITWTGDAGHVVSIPVSVYPRSLR